MEEILKQVRSLQIFLRPYVPETPLSSQLLTDSGRMSVERGRADRALGGRL